MKNGIKDRRINDMKLLWMLFWEIIFVVFVLPWAYIPIVLQLWNDETEPKSIRWIINQAIGYNTFFDKEKI